MDCRRGLRVFFLGVSIFICHAAGSAAVVLYPGDPEPLEKAAAEEFAAYWSRLSGQEVAVRAEPSRRFGRYHRFALWRPERRVPAAELVVFVGETREARLRAPLPEEMHAHGYRARRLGNRLILRGKSPAGTRLAVGEFLQRYGGVRWYMPTELGEHFPSEKPELPERIDYVDTPDFVSRRWSGLSRRAGDPWLERNGLAGRDQFHHRLHRMFTEAIYELRPDFFVMLKGRRVRPDDALGGHNLQICFGNPDAAKFAARKAAEFFDDNPGAESFSLGMNDTDAICECPLCQQWVDHEKTFRDRPDYSDLVFTFMNRAAEELAKTHPEKYLGCLAYYWAENVPSFPVHPKVMPYLTADRSQWRDADFQREDRELMTRWSQAGPERIGIYDYYYGSSFVIPRIFTELTEASVKHAANVGIDGFYAEIASTWSLDGPKAWFTSRLLWDVSGEREALLTDYYENFYGAAAEPMRKFFGRAEEIWMEQGGPAFWLKFYHDFAQLELYPPDAVAEMRGYLKEARRVAKDDRIRERVELVSDGFRLTEMYSDSYFGIKEATSPNVSIEELDWDSAVALIERAIAHREALEAHYDEVILPNELHRPTRRLETRADFFPVQKLNRLLERVAALAAKESALQAPLAALVEEIERTLPEVAARGAVLFGANGGEELLVLNGGFDLDVPLSGLGEELIGDPSYTPFSWRRATAAGTEPAFALSASTSSDGDFCVVARGAVDDRLFQRIPAKEGDLIRLSALAKGYVSPGSHVDLEISWRQKNGQAILGNYPSRDRAWPSFGDDSWQKLLVIAEAPPETEFAYVSIVVRNQGPEDWIYLDSVRCKRQHASGS